MMRLVTTRLFLLFTAALILCAVSAQAQSGSAADVVRRFYDVLLRTMKSGQSLGASGRYSTLQPAVAQSFDLPYMTSVAVGPKWASLSPSEHTQVVAAFQRYTVANYANQFDSYDGQQLRVGGEDRRGADSIVDTDIVKADGTSVQVKYRLHAAGGGWRIIDVYLDGSISQLAVRRSEFSSILNERGVSGLISTLTQKADDMVGASR